MTRIEGKVYLAKADMPKKCIQCPFLDGSDECILQDEDANFAADSFNDLQAGCPLAEVPAVRAGCWIPVTEYLPGPGAVLTTDGEKVYLTNGAWMYKTITGNIRIPANYGNGADVTHWMSLPQLPKEDT